MARRPRVPSRLIRTAADERAVAAGYSFDQRAADAVATFARDFCRHSQGIWAGQPFVLQDWQFHDVIEPLFGWQRPDGTRRFRRGHIEVPKKQGKSALASMISLYLLVADNEQGAVVGNAAIDREQAGIVFDVAAAMVRSSPELAAVLDVIDSRKTIAHPASGSKLFALSSDAPSKEGMNFSALILDELHRWKPEMFSVLYHSGAARRAPLFLSITTAGVFDIASIGWQQHEYARQIVDGTIPDDLAFFAYIKAADPAADWTAPSTWAAANPSLGITITLEELAEQCQAAQHSVGLENSFRRYRLNQWTQSTERWIPLSTFDASHGHLIDEAEYTGRKFYGGIDLGSVSDLSVVAYLFDCPHDPNAVDLVLRAFLPQQALRDGPNAVLYQEWARDGHLIVTPGTVTDETMLVQTVAADAARFGCHSVSVDRLFQAMAVSSALAAKKLEIFPCAMTHMSLAPLVNEAERLILSKLFHHGGHPILRAAVDAVDMELDNSGNRKPSRRDRSRKIDALIAVLLAIDRKLRAPAPTPAPNYQIMILGQRPLWRPIGTTRL